MKLTFKITKNLEENVFCERELINGIECNQEKYFFLGHSETQLKGKSCYLMRKPPKEIHKDLAKFGDFLGERDVGKRARKIGMLFSPLNKTLSLGKDAALSKIKPDIKVGFFRTYTFTDGCGFMSPEFSTEVQEKLGLHYQPSVVHVRYLGIEGNLVLKEDLTDVKVQFHRSMQKFATPKENVPESLNFLDVVDHSRPHVNGYLDAQMIMLLADRGVPVKDLLELQSRYYERLKDIYRDGERGESAGLFLRFKGEVGLLQDIRYKRNKSEVKMRVKALQAQELEEIKNARAKIRVLVPKSRVVFAVCDPHNKLNYGECYFNPTLAGADAESFPGTGSKFVVMRIPCHHPGDVRVLRQTDDQQAYENLRDCLVLPVKGPRPHAFECAGGALGGSKFFVSWSKSLIPKVVGKPCDYPLQSFPRISKFLAYVASKIKRSSLSSPEDRNEEGRREMLHYFATFTDDLTKRIDDTYMKYAVALGPSSKECRKLSKMFYRAVNLMGDRVCLEKKLLRLKEKEPPKEAESSTEPSPSAECNEHSPLVNEESGQNQTIKQPRRTWKGFKLRSIRQPNPATEAYRKMEQAGKKFVDTFRLKKAV